MSARRNAFHLDVSGPLETAARHCKKGKDVTEMSWKEVLDEAEKMALHSLEGIDYSQSIGKHLTAKDVNAWNEENRKNVEAIQSDLSEARKSFEEMEKFRLETAWKFCGVAPMDPSSLV